MHMCSGSTTRQSKFGRIAPSIQLIQYQYFVIRASIVKEHVFLCFMPQALPRDTLNAHVRTRYMKHRYPLCCSNHTNTVHCTNKQDSKILVYQNFAFCPSSYVTWCQFEIGFRWLKIATGKLMLIGELVCSISMSMFACFLPVVYG